MRLHILHVDVFERFAIVACHANGVLGPVLLETFHPLEDRVVEDCAFGNVSRAAFVQGESDIIPRVSDLFLDVLPTLDEGKILY